MGIARRRSALLQVPPTLGALLLLLAFCGALVTRLSWRLLYGRTLPRASCRSRTSRLRRPTPSTLPPQRLQRRTRRCLPLTLLVALEEVLLFVRLPSTFREGGQEARKQRRSRGAGEERETHVGARCVTILSSDLQILS